MDIIGSPRKERDSGNESYSFNVEVVRFYVMGLVLDGHRQRRPNAAYRRMCGTFIGPQLLDFEAPPMTTTVNTTVPFSLPYGIQNHIKIAHGFTDPFFQDSRATLR